MKCCFHGLFNSIPPLILVLFFLIVLLALFVLPPFPRLLIVLFRVLFCPLGAIRSWCRKRKTVGGWFGFACLGSKYSDSDLTRPNSRFSNFFSNHFHPPLTPRFRNLPILSYLNSRFSNFFKSLSPTPHFPIPQPTDFPSYPRDSFCIHAVRYYARGDCWVSWFPLCLFQTQHQILKLQSELSNHHLNTQTPISQTLPNHFHPSLLFPILLLSMWFPSSMQEGDGGLVGLFVPVGTYAIPHLNTQEHHPEYSEL